MWLTQPEQRTEDRATTLRAASQSIRWAVRVQQPNPVRDTTQRDEAPHFRGGRTRIAPGPRGCVTQRIWPRCRLLGRGKKKRHQTGVAGALHMLSPSSMPGPPIFILVSFCSAPPVPVCHYSQMYEEDTLAILRFNLCKNKNKLIDLATLTDKKVIDHRPQPANKFLPLSELRSWPVNLNRQMLL